MQEFEKGQKLLLEKFGFSSFRDGQEEVLRALLDGETREILAIWPTGAGKSLCYQLPAGLLSGTVVVSPLISLMDDQVQSCRRFGIRAAAIHSHKSRSDKDKYFQDFQERKLDILFVTPERFWRPEFLERLKEQKIELFVVDEAHCISSWGMDFRPDYSKLGEVIEATSPKRVLALTATATARVREDIIEQLRLRDVKTFNQTVVRRNLSLNVCSVYGQDEKIRHIVLLRHSIAGSAIIYFSLISTLEKFGKALHDLGLSFETYHGDLSSNERRRAQKRFLNGESQLILATPAFGLGIHKDDIRLIVHAEIPGSIEAYYQEVGRAGRDGKSSQAYLLYDEEDASIQMDFIKWATPEASFVRSVYRELKSYPQDFYQRGPRAIKKKLIFRNLRDFRVETTLNLLERWGVLKWQNDRRKEYDLEELGSFWLDSIDANNRSRVLQKGLLEMITFTSTNGCRMRSIQTYFGEENQIVRCGTCDVCKGAAD
ncbi:MAG: ATP-dependent DNA helicase [Bdellovibrionales bacterium CG10_big_fil_rev_8_21_14_0_10_45_34]|nr:MAG: ATP-dependent DNA helicase [Bdellovibrionales bacterium CG10_big_fil_rev_8_21_14_0_10_45_34]